MSLCAAACLCVLSSELTVKGVTVLIPLVECWDLKRAFIMSDLVTLKWFRKAAGVKRTWVRNLVFLIK